MRIVFSINSTGVSECSHGKVWTWTPTSGGIQNELKMDHWPTYEIKQ